MRWLRYMEVYGYIVVGTLLLSYWWEIPISKTMPLAWVGAAAFFGLLCLTYVPPKGPEKK